MQEASKAQKMNEIVQLTSGLWSFEISRLSSAATSKQIPFWSSNSFWVASSKARENSIDQNFEVSCTRSFIFCALDIIRFIFLNITSWRLTANYVECLLTFCVNEVMLQLLQRSKLTYFVITKGKSFRKDYYFVAGISSSSLFLASAPPLSR